MASTHDLLDRLYRSFNARDIDAVLAHLHPNVDWPNGMEGGRVEGIQAVRDYWTRQWRLMDPEVTPVRFEDDAAGTVTVDVHQVVKDLDGRVLVDRMVRHVYSFQDDLVTRMEIVEDL